MVLFILSWLILVTTQLIKIKSTFLDTDMNWCTPRLLQDENQISRRGGTTTVWDSGIGGLTSTSNIATQLEGEGDSMSVTLDSSIFQMETN